jgi:hypothetical protein
MGEPLDVAARLAEGHAAVDNIGDYVWACHLLGYQNPDLTLHGGQVRDWYSSEDGLDLRALEEDRAALDAVAAATENALRLQEQQLGALAGAWQGRGGDAAHDFLVRHGETSSAAVSAVRNAVGAFTTLRDELWHTVDEKVATAMSIDDRRQAERPEWLAATHTVSTGAGDRAAASELVDQQVKPFVDNDIRSDWLAAMQAAMAAIAAAFDAATATLTAEPAAMFEVPGDLGPYSMPTPPSREPPAEEAGTAPSSWTSPPPTAAPAVGPMTTQAPPISAAADPAFSTAPPLPGAPPPATTPAASAPLPATTPAASAPLPPAMPTMPPLGDPGGGLSGAAGGLGGIGSNIADALGGLLNRPTDALPEPPELNEVPEDDEPVPEDDEPVPQDKEPEGELDNETAAKTDELAETEEPVAGTDDGCVDEPASEAAPLESTPTPPPAPMPPPPAPMPPPPQPIVEPPPSQEPVSGETPCEIAADELPQAGP